MNCQEFATLSEYGIDVKVIVLHNDTLGMIVQLQDFFYNHHYSQCTLNKRKNLPMLAESLGVKGYAIEKQDDLIPVLKRPLPIKGRPWSISASRRKNGYTRQFPAAKH